MGKNNPDTKSYLCDIMDNGSNSPPLGIPLLNPLLKTIHNCMKRIGQELELSKRTNYNLARHNHSTVRRRSYVPI